MHATTTVHSHTQRANEALQEYIKNLLIFSFRKKALTRLIQLSMTNVLFIRSLIDKFIQVSMSSQLDSTVKTILGQRIGTGNKD